MATGEALEKMVADGLMPPREISGWRAAFVEQEPDPNDGEIIVFEDYFSRGFGMPCHPFLHDLVEYYKISICNFHPNSILAISVFITLCKGYLGIPPHFNLFCHFYCLKKKRVAGGSRVTRGVYLHLCDGMREEYLSMPLASSLSD